MVRGSGDWGIGSLTAGGGGVAEGIGFVAALGLDIAT